MKSGGSPKVPRNPLFSTSLASYVLLDIEFSYRDECEYGCVNKETHAL